MEAGQGFAGLMAALAVPACASAPDPPPIIPAPDFSEPATSPAPAGTVLYTDCMTHAISSAKVAHLSDGNTKLIRFICSCAPAQSFYEALAVLGDEAVSVGDRTGGRSARRRKSKKICSPRTVVQTAQAA